jgi:flagellar M-ring protein FliF
MKKSLIVLCIFITVMTFNFTACTAKEAMIPVIDAPLRDIAALDRIVLRISQEGINPTITPDGIIMVSDEQTARRMRGILIREDLIPAGTDPWQIFDRERWTIREFRRNVNAQ